MRHVIGLFTAVVLFVMLTPPNSVNSVVGYDGVDSDQNIQVLEVNKHLQEIEIIILNNIDDAVASVSPVPSMLQDNFEIGPKNDTAQNASFQAAAFDQSANAAMNDSPTPNRPTARVEPGTLLLFGIGLAGLAVLSFNRKK